MTLWKPYRVLFRQGYHYFRTLKEARAFIKNFEPNKIRYKQFIIEKPNPVKKLAKLPYNEIYDDYESLVLTNRGWETRKVR